MCTQGLKPHEHGRDITVYKTLAKTKDGELNSIKCVLMPRWDNYVYTDGENIKRGDEGLHSYESVTIAKSLALFIASFGIFWDSKHPSDKRKAIESMVVVKATIPADTPTEIGYHGREDQVAYVSDKLNINTELIAEYPIQDDKETYKALMDELKLMA